MLPLSGIRVLDFSTLLPGPMATLLLAEAGAQVIKVERPDGEDMRRYEPRFGGTSASFAMLNRGKRSVALDLKAPNAKTRLLPLLETADVLVEQFRPGVMERLGLGYKALREINAGLIYCSITGYGQHGPKSPIAAHDLNYQADTGMLALAAGSYGAPVVPPALVADIAGGSYPAVMNILLALRQRDRTHKGCYIDISMTDCLFPFMLWAMGTGNTTGKWPRPGQEMLSGGSPRYQVYRTADGQFLAAAPLEDRFWSVFCEVIELPARLRDDSKDAQATRRAVAELISQRSAVEWLKRLEGKDACCNLVRNVSDALNDSHYLGRGLFTRKVTSAAGGTLMAGCVPVADTLRDSRAEVRYPTLGEDNDLLA
ncbi:MAG: CoA transferase [Betaproteobacteria bacterium]|nr:CoA transferase [Betaproteobacteria bacterium]